MGNVFDASQQEWQLVRPEVTQQVFGKTLLSDEVKVVLTRVAPGGRFSMHKDSYSHLFYFLGGEGLVRVGDNQHSVRAGHTVQIAAGEAHAYENTGTDDLMLISINLPGPGR
ncbi:MAG: cupin domain-containing protein [Chloroflexi bacterium]|nr:cupin domain-containing protein [Chloroflexota bacterium]